MLRPDALAHWTKRARETTFTRLPVGCRQCSHTTVVTIAGWNPERLTRSSFTCPRCRRGVPAELPGMVIWTGPPLSAIKAAMLWRLKVNSDEWSTRIVQNLEQAHNVWKFREFMKRRRKRI